MKFNNLKIANQLRIAIFFIFLVVLLLGGNSWYQANTQWKNTQNLYNHPQKVRQAITGLEADIISMDRNMKEYIQADTLEKRQNILQHLSENRADVNRRFKMLYSQYLGPKANIQKVEKEFDKWNVFMNEVIDLVRTGKNKNVQEMMSINGAEGINTNQLLDRIRSIDIFTNQEADQFYQNARNENNRLKLRLLFLLGIILIFLFVFYYLLYHSIHTPIKKLTLATQKFSEGNYEARVNYSSKNELGTLAEVFNRMAFTIQSQIKLEQKTFRFNTSLFKREDLLHFSRLLINELTELTQSQIGAFYLLNKTKAAFTLLESYGLSAKAKTRFSAKLKEGEFGKALAGKKIVHLREIPDDTSFTFATTSGNFKPKEIITLPIISGKETIAVISLASIYAYPSETLLLLQNIFSSLTARINGVLLFHQIKEQATQLEKQNTELEIQGKELSAQSVELSRQNTELKMQKNQLDEANRLKSTFLSNMSHELRTPLNSVIALSSVLKRKLKTSIPKEEYSYIDVIERNGKQLLELINDVLDLSHIESGRVEIEQTDLNIKELINEMTTLIEPQAREKNIILKSLVKKDLPSLKSDGNKIRHILQNLIGNAVKFTEKGKIEVTAFEKDEYLHILVSDTGIGIPPDQISNIFDEFRQIDSSTSRKYGGTGLGLSIAKRYAHMLGGTIEVKSAPGKGSDFTLILPLEPVKTKIAENPLVVRQPSAVIRKKRTVAENKAQAKEKTILIVEDSEPAIIQLKDILNETGFQVLISHNGREALEQIARTLPDALILDLMMPGIDGFQVLEAVRSNVDTAELPVLVLTAKHLEGKDLKNLKHNHIYQLLQKGDVNREQLLQLVFDMVFPEKETTGETEKKKVKTHRNIKTQSGEKPLILVVEDNVDNLLTLKSLLSENYRTIEAYDGQDGIIKAKTYHPDLILMDIAMPVMNGFRAFDAIRKEKNLKHIPIVAVTASAMTADRDEILHYGFDGYISKPIDIDKFEKTINNFFKEQ
ncbi:MAG: hypothetical protein IEMM0006_0705 [bacterium]|nr:MAG: hypothetical protein IEMM0006_0705 [bacterium]